MKLTLLRLLIIAGLAPAAMSLPAAAWQAGSPGPQALSRACADDYARLCRGVEPGDTRVLRCLSDQHEALSTGCSRALRVAAVMQACAQDLREFCQGVVPGGGRGIACLRANRDRLSGNCVGVVKSAFPRLLKFSWSERSPHAPLPRPGELAPSYEPPDLSDAPLK